MSSKKTFQKKGGQNKKPLHVAKSVIAKEVEARELTSCKSRVQSEFKLFSKLNPGAFSKTLQLRTEPKLVKLDSEFASTAKTPQITKVKDGTKQIKSATDLYAKAASEFSQTTSLDNMPIDHLRQFSTLPISTRTKKALVDNCYKQCTRVQHASLPSSLAQQDLFVLSCTGSGKTLAFIIPVLETLWQQRWNRSLGLGALIIEPTRELALQTFHVLRRIGVYHDLSAGLLIGGTSFEEERRAIADMNILVCTPGRLIHHLEQSSGLDLTNIVSLVIDECDHLLDIGFAEQFETIAPLLPSKKKLAKTIAATNDPTLKQQLMQGQIGFHTMLFSATISPSVQKFAKRVLSPDLRLISLTNASGNNPDNLSHRFLIVPETEKVRTLFEFLRVHRSNKTVIFVSTARQASYLYELFRGMSIKAPVHRLHSKLGHQSRTQEYYQFQQEQYGVLICTDVAARGLDLTGVSWVVHFDCPTSVTQYTHRSGRTARLKGKGTNLLMLTPHQIRFAHLLHLNNPDLKLQQVGLPQFRADYYNKLAQYYSEHPIVKNHAEKAVMSYMQHIIHEQTDNNDLLKQLVPDKAARVQIIKHTGQDLVQAAATPSQWLKNLKSLASKETTALMINLFDITKYDVIGLCRSYGLKSVPVVVSADDQKAFEEETEDLLQQQSASSSSSQKSSGSKKATKDDEDNDQELTVLTRVNAELEDFIKRTRLLEQSLQKNQPTPNNNNNITTTTIFTKAKVQPKAVDTIGNHSRNLNNDEIVCDVFTTWSDDDIDDDERQTQLATFTNRFEELKHRYQQIDRDDKQYVKEAAVKKRRYKQNMLKLEKLRKMGYDLTLDQLEDMLTQKKAGGDIGLESFRTGMGDDSDDEGQGVFDELGQSDDDEDDEGFGVGYDNNDDDSDSGNEFHKMMKREAAEAQKKQQQPRNLLNESSDDDDSNDDDDDDDDDDDEPLPPQKPTQLKKNGKIIQVSAPAQPQPKKNTKQSTAALLGMDSDDDSDNVPAPKPANAKQAFSLDETSSDDDDDDDDGSDDEPTPPPMNKNGKRLAPSQIQQTSKNAPKAPQKPVPKAVDEKPKRTMRKL